MRRYAQELMNETLEKKVDLNSDTEPKEHICGPWNQNNEVKDVELSIALAAY